VTRPVWSLPPALDPLTVTPDESRPRTGCLLPALLVLILAVARGLA
jgi:hypothetical protein